MTRAINTYESIIKLKRSDTIINDLLTRVIAGYEKSDASINEILTRAIESYESIIKPIRSDTSINDLLTRAIAGKVIIHKSSGKCFMYATKTIANLTKCSKKPGNYNGTIIFESEYKLTSWKAHPHSI